MGAYAEKTGVHGGALWTLGLRSLSAHSRIAASAALTTIVAVAVIVRIYFLIGKGGLENDQLAWGVANYFGGLTGGYLTMRDFILAGQYEVRPWPYLPGYPAFLAILKLLGVDNLRDVRTIQALLDAAAIWPLFYVVRSLTASAPFALSSCCLYALTPSWAAGSTYLLAESLLPPLVITLLAALVWIRSYPLNLLHWATLGLVAAILAFFRTEMTLLIGPLALWAMVVAPPRRRVICAAAVVFAFAVPLFAWALRNYVVHGLVMLTPPAKWYAFWSGLGHVENDFGYFVDDGRASKLTLSMGLGWLTPATEAYWKDQYLAAWHDHPLHVIKTILYRFQLIATKYDGLSSPLALDGIVYGALSTATPIALIWLALKRRWADTLLVAGPMGYALISLGLMYVELRYVRYAGLTYLLGAAVLLSLIVDSATQHNQWKWPSTQAIKVAVGIVGCTAAAAYFLISLPQLHQQTKSSARFSLLNLKSIDMKFADVRLETIRFTEAIPDAKMSASSSGLAIRARAPAGRYLLIARLADTKADAVVIRYRMESLAGQIGIGILSADSRRWLDQTAVTTTPQGSMLASAFQPGSTLVLFAQLPDLGNEIDVIVREMDITFVCFGRKIKPLLEFFNRAPIAATACAQGTRS